MRKDTASPIPPQASGSKLRDTQEAFDSVAADYDGPRGNNREIQDLRDDMWRELDRTFPASSRLIDLGCGTGLDSVRLALRGHHVTATDWSTRMVDRTRDRAQRQQVTDRVRTLAIGAHELRQLKASGAYDGAYSNLGPLNCVPELADVSQQCARLLKPGGALVFSVIGRVCPWEIAHYLRLRRWRRATIRFARHVVPVGMNAHTIWTRYYGPREFYRAFEGEFRLDHFRGLRVFAPPPYLPAVRERYPRLHELLRTLDHRIAGWPLIRGMGDHFLMVMKKR